jgi:hypothetical protein
MTNIVTLHGNKRWRADLEYESRNGPIAIEHFFEEISDLHLIIEHGPDWNTLKTCIVRLNRTDDGADQNSVEKASRTERA